MLLSVGKRPGAGAGARIWVRRIRQRWAKVQWDELCTTMHMSCRWTKPIQQWTFGNNYTSMMFLKSGYRKDVHLEVMEWAIPRRIDGFRVLMLIFRVLVWHMAPVSSRMNKAGRHRNFNEPLATIDPNTISKNYPYRRSMDELTPWRHNTAHSKNPYENTCFTTINRDA